MLNMSAFRKLLSVNQLKEGRVVFQIDGNSTAKQLREVLY
jgi:hypothetical protein